MASTVRYTDSSQDLEPHSGEAVTPLLQIAGEIRSHNRFLVTSHARPDGDAVGSTLAMGSILHRMGKDVDMVLADPVPQVYQTLPGVGRIRHAREVDSAAYDVAIILECDSTQRTGLTGLDAMRLINIDHHLTGAHYGSLNWIDADASAVAAMVFEVAVALGVDVTPGIATCLYTALMTDTGSFTYPGTSADTFTLAHALIDLGARADSVARDVLYSVPASRLQLLGRALSRIRIDAGVAWSWITQEDLCEFSATDEDSEGTVNYLISIAGVEAAIFLREIEVEPRQFRTSLRSKSKVDVSAVASKLGGGGHRNAAGCTLEGPFDDAVANVLMTMREELQRAASSEAVC